MEKAGDETVDSMFDEIVETKIAPDGAVEVNLVSPSPEEVENAASELSFSWRKFRDINSPGAHLGIEWWRAAENLMLANNRLKDLFCGRDRSPRSIRLCHEYKLTLISDKKRLRADA
jgi:hypothetical protein